MVDYFVQCFLSLVFYTVIIYCVCVRACTHVDTERKNCLSRVSCYWWCQRHTYLVTSFHAEIKLPRHFVYIHIAYVSVSVVICKTISWQNSSVIWLVISFWTWEVFINWYKICKVHILNVTRDHSYKNVWWNASAAQCTCASRSTPLPRNKCTTADIGNTRSCFSFEWRGSSNWMNEGEDAWTVFTEGIYDCGPFKQYKWRGCEKMG